MSTSRPESSCSSSPESRSSDSNDSLSILRRYTSLGENEDPIDVVVSCVRRAVHGQFHRLGVVGALDRWLEEQDAHGVMPFVNRVNSIYAGSRADSKYMSSLKKWCINHQNVHLAFFMALATDDWTLAHMMIANSASTPNPHLNTLLVAVEEAVKTNNFSAGAAMLSACPVTVVGYRSFCSGVKQSRELADKCIERELTDHALLIMRDDAEYIQNHHGSSQRSLLDFILINAYMGDNWDVVKVLMDGCTNTNLFYYVHQRRMGIGTKT